MGSDQVKKIVLGVLLAAAAAVLLFRLLGGGGDGFDSRASGEMLTIVCEETGNEWEMERGRLRDTLLTRKYPLDPSQGLSSQFADGRPVAFPKDRKDWERMVQQTNEAIEAYRKSKE